MDWELDTGRGADRQYQYYRHSRGVNKALVVMLQSLFCIFFGLETHETKFAKLPLFSVLQAAVGQCPKVGEHRTETFILHLRIRQYMINLVVRELAATISNRVCYRTQPQLWGVPMSSTSIISEFSAYHNYAYFLTLVIEAALQW